jgi:hypothetical protein
LKLLFSLSCLISNDLTAPGSHAVSIRPRRYQDINWKKSGSNDMNIGLRTSALALLTVAAMASGAQADIIYNFQNFAAFQNGHTISGTITTDGTIGTITGANITALNISWAGGPNPGGFSAIWTPSTMSGVTATATDLTISGGGQMTLFAGPVFDGNNQFFIRPAINSYSARSSSGISWSSINPTGAGTAITFASNAGAAAVPEPSTFALLGMGAISLMGVHRRKRKNAALNE